MLVDRESNTHGQGSGAPLNPRATESRVDEYESELKLTNLATEWSLVFESLSGIHDVAHLAACQLLCRYAGAVHRFLLKAVKDPDVADELDQEFAVRFMKGEFRKGDPSSGRFRDQVKRAADDLVAEYHRRNQLNLPNDAPEPELAVGDGGLSESHQQFSEIWRKDLLDRAWAELASLEKSTGQPYYTVLRMKVSHPDLTSDKLARQLSAAIKKAYSAGAVRQTLQCSREKYVEYLVKEVVASLKRPTRKELEAELVDLRLIHYVRPFMAKIISGDPRLS
jgi:hypothetical protein